MPVVLLVALVLLAWLAALVIFVISLRRRALLPPKTVETYDLVVQAAASDERRLRPLDSAAPPETNGRLDSFSLADDPQARRVAFEEVTVLGPLGSYPAWHVASEGTTWAVLAHGKGANRREFLRMLPACRAASVPALVITYRNDRGAPSAPEGRYGYGATEWPDLEAAVAHAVAHGAERVVLGGCSMGAAICLAFLKHSPLAARVVALVFDSPMVDFAATVAHGSKMARVPGFIAGPGQQIAGRILRIDWDALDYLTCAAEDVHVPVLVFHGAADRRVPVETSDRFAAALPGLVRFVRPVDVGHVRSWNADPAAYERAIEDFLRGIVGP